MNIIFRKLHNCIQRNTMRMICVLLGIFCVSCDFNGPWSFYPEEREVYTGIFTYGYIIEGESPEVCFSKTYELEETSAENFSFYDSAKVIVSGTFYVNKNEPKVKMDLELLAKNDKKKCFYYSNSTIDYPRGLAGETYTLNAYFKWDSAGKKVESKFFAEATIPTGFKIKGVNAPQKDGSYKWKDLTDTIETKSNSGTGIKPAKAPYEVEFLEYPNDINVYGFVVDYNETMGGVLLNMEYDIKAAENVNTTMNNMLNQIVSVDSMGYNGYSLRNGLENLVYMGFQENRVVAGINMLDTIFISNMNFPLGDVNLTFYATDKAYFLYHRYLLQSFEDPTVMPQSNIKNGMGVFSGMSRLDLKMKVTGTGVKYSYIAIANCIYDDFDSKACRLYQDVYCSGITEYSGEGETLYDFNYNAYFEYESSDNYKNVVTNNEKYCFAPAIKAAMMLEKPKWSVFLPDDISSTDKQNAYNDAIKRYCVASNFKSNKIASCDKQKKECMESKEENNCKQYLWQWCADRNWEINKFPQCESGLVSRYYLQEQNSSILKKIVDEWCSKNKGDAQCER